jgi:hypothetical protein
MTAAALPTTMPDVDSSSWPIVEVRVEAAPDPTHIAEIVGAVDSRSNARTHSLWRFLRRSFRP